MTPTGSAIVGKMPHPDPSARAPAQHDALGPDDVLAGHQHGVAILEMGGVAMEMVDWWLCENGVYV